MEQVVAFDRLRELRELFDRRGNIQAGNRPLQQRRNISMVMMLDVSRNFAWFFVRACAFALRGGNEQVVAYNRESRGIPIGGNETQWLEFSGCARRNYL